ncbi:MAG: hypothetical protein HY736_02045 [Verrucomicrobia bacterium]|nr:hypothetical protein [Verrucomicrobiota bacterium]
MISPAELRALSVRQHEWGRFGPLRNFLARRIAGRPARPPDRAAFACTIVKLDRLGDFVLATGAIGRLLEHFGAAHCALITSFEVAALAAREFPNVARHSLPNTARRLFREIAPSHRAWQAALAAFPSEHVVCLRHQRSLYRDLVLRAIPARQRWWLENSPFSDRAILDLTPAAASYPLLCDPKTPTELAAHCALVGALLGQPVAPQEILPCLRQPAPGSGSLPIVVSPLGHDRIRDVPAAHLWPALLARSELADAPIILAGSTAQHAQLASFAAAAPAALRARCTIAAGMPLDDWISLIGGARLVLSADSASAHIATALDRPLVAWLGGGHPGVLAPWARSAKQRWLQHPQPCYGCDWSCPYPEPHCLTGIGPDAVSAAIEAVTAGTPAP